MNVFFSRENTRTSGVGVPEMTEAERQIADVVSYGVVTEIDYSDESNPVVRVGIGDPSDEDGYIETGWLPMGTVRSNEWDPLKIGESVRVLSDNGEFQNGVVAHAIHNESFPAPGNRPDLWRKNLGKGFLQYDEATDTLTLNASDTGTIILTAGQSTITISGGEITLDSAVVDATGNSRVGTGATVAVPTASGQMLHFQNGILVGVQ